MVSVHGSDILNFFGASDAEWLDWRWQLRHSVRSTSELTEILEKLCLVDAENLNSILSEANPLEMKITPHIIEGMVLSYRSAGLSSFQSFFATYVPVIDENIPGALEREIDDGRGELQEDVNPVRSIINFFHNRALLMVESMCPAYCRYCFRRSVIGDGTGFYNRRFVKEGIEYIRSHPEISDVILSGGDPMVLADEPLSEILGALREISHVKVLRIDTKTITSLPQRFTTELCRILREHKPLYVLGNFLHVAELSPETIGACERLVDHGVSVLSHTPLLRGINDDIDSLQNLFEGLIHNLVKPHYLIHFIPTRWTEHFRVPIEEGLRIYEQLHARLSGIALPTYIVYLPEGRGKVPILPQFLSRVEGKRYYFRNFEGHEVCYVDGPVQEDHVASACH